MARPIPKIYVTRFFQLISTRQFAEAERILERVKQKMHVNERNRGYFQALYGMLITQKNNDDRYAFLSSADLSNTKQLRKYRLEFLSHAESRFHADYDRGFFEAWADFMKILPKLEVSSMTMNNKTAVEKGATSAEVRTKAEEEPKGQTSGKDEAEEVEPSQSTLVDFAE